MYYGDYILIVSNLRFDETIKIVVEKETAKALRTKKGCSLLCDKAIYGYLCHTGNKKNTV